MLGRRPLLVGMWLSAAVLIGSVPVYAKNSLITEAEKLRDGLPRKEKEQRRMFTIRLANLYFSEAVKLSADKPDDSKAQKMVQKYRERAVNLYREYLSGNNGEYDKPHPEQKVATEFQLARVLADLGHASEAKSLWQKLVKEDDFPTIAAESALSLAELTEAQDPASESAFDLYGKALTGETKHDTRIYIHYRRAWILRNQDRYPEAVVELKKSLFDSQGQLKDEVLNDLIVFYSMSGIDPKEVIDYFEVLGERIHHKNLLNRLADAYLAAGNKPAGVLVLTEVNGKNPSLLHQIKLLEESYGLRNWELYGRTLESVNTQDIKDAEPKLAKKVNAILKRIIVQLDSERKTSPETLEYFVSSANLFVSLYPDDDVSFKLITSIAGTYEDPKKQAAYLTDVLAKSPVKMTPQQKKDLGEQLVVLHQKAGNHEAAAHQAKTLMTSESNKPDDKRRFQFVYASELFDSGKVEESLPVFLSIAEANALDDMGRKSMMVVVRERGQAKQYAEALALSGPWLKKAAASEEVRKSVEFKAITEVHESSEFEWAAGAGDTPEALAIFRKYCDEKRFTPQSCNNAKGMAARLKNYDALIGLLKAENAADELATIYETNGFFEEAAKYYEEKLLSKSSGTVTDYLKVALFYEIPGNLKGRDRCLEKLTKKLKKGEFSSPQEEALVLRTFKDAGMMSRELLALPWSEGTRCAMLDELMAGDSKSSLKKQLLNCKESPGPSWRAAVLAEVDELSARQAKLKFHGKNSEARFKRRLNAVKKFDATVDKYMERADAQSLLAMAEKGQQVYESLSEEIMATPLPKDLPAEQVAEVQESLTKMAEPFREKAAAYQELVTKQRQLLVEQPAGEKAATEPSQPKKVPLEEVKTHLKALNKDPDNRQAIQALYQVYKENDHPRVAAYFEGRLNTLQGGE